MKRPEAIIAFAFGGRTNQQPGKSNEALAQVVNSYQWANPNTVIVAQQEIAGQLKPAAGCTIRWHRKEGDYLDTDEVATQALIHLHNFDPTAEWSILVAAQPFIHRFQAVGLVRKIALSRYPMQRFIVRRLQTGRIPFDRESIQWWTRGPFRFFLYAIGRVALDRRGP